jgi:2-phospho-L-lactate guanylyltransferase
VSWTVIIPVKRLDLAKTRLREALGHAELDELVLAMAMDATAAALASQVVGRVVVVTADPAAADAAGALGADVVVDVPDAGLNPALAYAAQMARPPGAAATLPGVAALAADLPALRTTDLTEALQAAQAVNALARPSTDPTHQTALRAFVADASGAGTVLLAAPPGTRLEPCFGANSAAAHAASGAVELTGPWPGLRRDVDTAGDLADAVRLGVGPRTAAAMAAITITVTGPAATGVRTSTATAYSVAGSDQLSRG